MRRLALAVLLLGTPQLAYYIFAQDAPPPRRTAPRKPTPTPKAGGGGKSGGGTTTAAPASAVLLIDADMNCTVTIDGKSTYKIKANSPSEITLAVGEHLLKAVSEDNRRKLEQVVKAAAGQTVVPLKLLTAAASTAPEDFDRAAAKVYTALTDLKVMGGFIEPLWKKSFFFHDRGITAAFHTANQFLVRETDEFKKYVPSDAARQRVFDELNKLTPQGTKYVELVTQAITAAQSANSTMGEPTNTFGQAQAILAALSIGDEISRSLKDSPAFRDALPPDVRSRAGLPPDPRDFRLGADYAQSVPLMIAVVEKNGLVEKMGFKAGDRILSVNGRQLQSLWDFKMAIKESSGRKLSIVFEREGKQQSKDVNAPSTLS
jgi:PDZ domain